MKPILNLMAVAAILLPTFSACSGGAGASAGAPAAEQSAPAKAKQLDITAINTYAKKDIADLTEADFDFMLDQLEIFIDQGQGMSKQEYQAWFKQLDDATQGAAFIVAMTVAGGKKKGKLTESQLKRCDELEARDPSK